MHEEMSVYVYVAMFVCVQIEMSVFICGDDSVCTCKCMCACGDVYVFVHMEKKGKHQMSSFNTSHHGFESGSLTEPERPPVWQDQLFNKL